VVRSGAMPPERTSGRSGPRPSTAGAPTSTAGTFGRPPASPLRPGTVQTTPRPSSPYDAVPGVMRQPRNSVRVSDGAGGETPRRVSLVERQATYGKSQAGTPSRNEAGESSTPLVNASTSAKTTPAQTPRRAPRESDQVSPLKTPAKAKTLVMKSSKKSPKTDDAEMDGETLDAESDRAPAPSRPPPPPESPAGYLDKPFRVNLGDGDEKALTEIPEVGTRNDETFAEPAPEQTKNDDDKKMTNASRLATAPSSAENSAPSTSGSLHDTQVLSQRLQHSETLRRTVERQLAMATERARVMGEILHEQNALLENVPAVIAAGGAARWRAKAGAGGGYGAESLGVRKALESFEIENVTQVKEKTGVASLARRVAELERALAAKETEFSSQTAALEALEVEQSKFDADVTAMRLAEEASRRASAAAGKRAREVSIALPKS
jgi:hypothetical protein